MELLDDPGIKKQAKKLKAHERKELLPLYWKHSEYLCRALKTAIDGDQSLIDYFYDKIEAWQRVATCHEVAINNLNGEILETHQNDLGLEYEYTHHPKAKNVARKYRVKIIWEMLKVRIEEDPTLDSYEIYADLEAQKYISCPVCDETIYDLTDERWLESNCNCYEIQPSGMLSKPYQSSTYPHVPFVVENAIKSPVFLEKYAIYVEELDCHFVNEEGEEILDHLFLLYTKCYMCSDWYRNYDTIEKKDITHCSICFSYCEKHGRYYPFYDGNGACDFCIIDEEYS